MLTIMLTIVALCSCVLLAFVIIAAAQVAAHSRQCKKYRDAFKAEEE